MGLIRYNLGSGAKYKTDWVNVDIHATADIQADLGIFPWKIESESVDEILASHILEHFTKQDGRLFIAECARILKPGGLLYIAVPDMDKFIDCKVNGDYGPLNGYGWIDLNYFMGGDEREGNLYQRHRYMYTFESLAYALDEYGFNARKRGPMPFDSHEYAAISLYVTAVKE